MAGVLSLGTCNVFGQRLSHFYSPYLEHELYAIVSLHCCEDIQATRWLECQTVTAVDDMTICVIQIKYVT